MLFISNIVLDFININLKIMKKLFLPVTMLAYVIVLAGIWIFQTRETENSTTPVSFEYLFIGIIILFFSMGFYFMYKRARRKKQGFPIEDELSKKVARKAAAVSYYISLLLWLALIYLQVKLEINPRLILGYGLIGMALSFVGCWMFFNFKGLGDE